jgi:hypothetical protein
MDAKMISEVCKKIYEQFPNVEGTVPEVRPQPNETQLFIFQSKGMAANQKSIPIQIRVLVNKSGDIIKVTSSR